ncbi:MAG TPA: putative LPS assembly protein LptD [Blastocatellia bacterium]|jgi:hypothetical protein|nr:putative LPS assembly protein LptD [Blastocatellia bacterium]
MARFSKSFSTALCTFLLIAVSTDSILASYGPPVVTPTQSSRQEDKKAKKERKRQRREQKADAEKKDAEKETRPDNPASKTGGAAVGEAVEVVADAQSKNGDLFIYEGYVNATLGDIRLQADRVTFNNVTGDMVAEGNVIFDQGADQRVAARRAEINWTSRKGVFWDTTGFTNRTQTGEYVFFTAARVQKTGPATYELFDADVTACEDVIPKWSFHARRAELKMGDRITLHNSVFRVKSLPAFLLPFAWIPATRNGRKSGFLLPTTGTSNQKGRTLKLAYYQTLGQSADITFRSDIYTQRGLGFGGEFRAQTDEKSYMRLGLFAVKDRLFGAAGESQGGAAFVAEGQQFLPHGWVAVGNVSLVTSLRFRQVFSDDISQVIDPRRESTFYANNNTRSFSFNFLASNETTTLFRPSRDRQSAPGSGSNFDIKIRQAPQVDMTLYPRRVVDNLPIYFSFDSSLGALKREETVDSGVVFVTPAAVQRFDFQPKITAPLATVAGVAITPSLTLRQTFYTSSLNPGVRAFDPELFATSAADPRLDPSRPEYRPSVKLFDRSSLDPVLPENVSRTYGELSIDVRPPSLEKYFLNDDGSSGFKHLIEPYVTYRLIKGIGREFNKIIRFDDRDAVANTNEFEYALVNRFYTARRTSDLNRKRSRRQRGTDLPSEMEPVRPKVDKENRKKKKKADQGTSTAEAAPADTKAAEQKSADQKPAEQKPQTSDEANAKGDKSAAGGDVKDEVNKEEQGGRQAEASDARDRKSKLATGEQAEMGQSGVRRERRERQAAQGDGGDDGDQDESTQAGAVATNENAPAQPFEFLTVKVAQKYFFDRDFGGALAEGRRNQFYPINTLSGFTYGGRARSFSPANVAVRYRPLSWLYADLRMDVGSTGGFVRNVVVGGGLRKDKLSVSASYYLSRRIQIAPNTFEPGTFPGNQIVTTLQWGDADGGLYGGTRIGYDFTDRFITSDQVTKGRLRNSRSYLGYGWDCCGVQFNYNTFKAGLRNESAFSFTFTLAGIGSFGTDQFSQLGGGRGGRKRGKRNRRNAADDDNLP